MLYTLHIKSQRCCSVHCKGYWALPYSRVSSPSTSRSASLSRHSLEVVLTRTAPEETQEHQNTFCLRSCAVREVARRKEKVETFLFWRSHSGGFLESQHVRLPVSLSLPVSVRQCATSLQVRASYSGKGKAFFKATNLQGILFRCNLDWKVQRFYNCHSLTLFTLHWTRSCTPVPRWHAHTLLIHTDSCLPLIPPTMDVICILLLSFHSSSNGAKSTEPS